MAESLSVKIALEGGAEIERQLAEIGQAGQKAFGEIAKSAEKVGGFRNIKPEEVTSKLKDLGITGVESINKIQAAVRSAGRLEGLVQGIETAQAAFVGLARAAGIVGVAGAAAMVALTKQTLGFAQSITKTSAEAIKLGVSFQAFDDLRRKMGQAGVGVDAITSGITKIQDNINKLELSRLQKAVETMKQLQAAGIRFAPGQGPDALKQLQDAATKIGPAGDFARESLRRLNLEAARSGNVRFLPGVVPTLEQLRAAIDPVAAGMQKLGITGLTVGEQYTQITEKLKAMTDVAERNRLALLLLGETAGTAFIQSQSSGNAAEDAANRLNEAINRLKASWNDFGSVSFAPTITAGIDLITASLTTLQQAITNFGWETFANAAKAAFDLIAGAISAFTLQGMLSWIAQAVVAWTGLIDLIRRGMAAMTGGGGTTPSLSDTGNVGGMAGGGLLGGRGTGTSDSNLAWLSRGEYVTPAHAVAQPGVLAFLEALRRSGGNLSRVLNGMGRFALGGMVPRAIPAYAAGGLNRGGGSSASRVLNLTIEGRSFGGLSVPEATAQSLERFAVHSQIASTGRRPSWKR